MYHNALGRERPFRKQRKPPVILSALHENLLLGKTASSTNASVPRTMSPTKVYGQGSITRLCERKEDTDEEAGTRELNRGAAELVNTKNCSVSQIETLNRVIKFIRDQWSSIKREGQTPTNARVQHFAEASTRHSKARAVERSLRLQKQWDRLKKFITGIKSVQIECRSTEWCDKKGCSGYGRY